MHRLIFFLLLAFATPVRADLIAINSLADTDANDGECTLREAIISANFDVPSGFMPGECAAGSGSADTIVFDVSGTVILSADLPDITEGVSIIGPGPDLVIIDGQDLYTLFFFNSPTNDQVFKMQGLSLTRGLTPQVRTNLISVWDGDELTLDFIHLFNNDLAQDGRGVGCYRGTLFMNWSAFEANGNESSGPNRALTQLTDCAAEISYSLIANNMARGIAISNLLPLGERRDVVIRHSTISGNTSASSGVGISFGSAETSGAMWLYLEHSTIILNTTTERNGGGIYISGAGNVLTLTNSIVALNNDLDTFAIYPDLSIVANTGAVVTGGFNWIGDNTGDSWGALPAGSPNGNNDWVGTIGTPKDPLLSALISTGGPTKVHLPSISPASPVIDNGKCPGELHDQQGKGDPSLSHRIFDTPGIGGFPTSDKCDIGAVESTASYLPALLQPIALLAGPYDGGGNMRTDLNAILPTAQPYNSPPWNYFGSETLPFPDITTDWVLLKLRTGAPLDPSMNTAMTAAAVVREEGELANSIDESSPFSTTESSVPVVPGMYYLEIDHRNHLPAMSRIPYAITPTSTIIDMRYPGSLWGINAAQDLGDGFVGLWGGDGNRDNGVTAFDFLNIWLAENGGAGYSYGDFNLSGDVTAFDFLNVWLLANGISSQVP